MRLEFKDEFLFLSTHNTRHFGWNYKLGEYNSTHKANGIAQMDYQ